EAIANANRDLAELREQLSGPVTGTDAQGRVQRDAGRGQRSRDRAAAASADTATVHETEVEAQLTEAHRAMRDALAQYMERYERPRVARGTGGAGAPRQGIGAEGVSRAGARLTEARVALSRARNRLEALHEQASGARARGADARERADVRRLELEET